MKRCLRELSHSGPHEYGDTVNPWACFQPEPCRELWEVADRDGYLAEAERQKRDCHDDSRLRKFMERVPCNLHPEGCPELPI